MSVTLAFDVYGTLIDTQGVVAELNKIMGETAGNFSQKWREKQLEYSFRRALMQKYEHFDVCTNNALDYSCALYDITLSTEQKHTLLECYCTLPAFLDVRSISEIKVRTI